MEVKWWHCEWYTRRRVDIAREYWGNNDEGLHISPNNLLLRHSLSTKITFVPFTEHENYIRIIPWTIKLHSYHSLNNKTTFVSFPEKIKLHSYHSLNNKTTFVSFTEHENYIRVIHWTLKLHSCHSLNIKTTFLSFTEHENYIRVILWT